MSLRAVVVEDEHAGREALLRLLDRYCPEVVVVASADSVATGIAAITEHRPELVFLDIELAGGSAFALLEGISWRNFAVIFTTAHDQYALRAIKAAALDYLLKPIDPDELVAAVAKLKRPEAKPDTPADDRIAKLLQAIGAGAAARKRIALPTAEGVLVVTPAEIIRCEASGNYTSFVLTRDRKLLVSRTLKVYEDLLEHERFFRIHIQHLINLDHMQQYLRLDGGSVKMSDGLVLPISRRRREAFLEALSSSTLGLRLEE